MSYLANKKVLVLVADAARARLFSPASQTGELEEIQTLVNPNARLRGADLQSDRAGRSYDSVGGGRHGMEQEQNSKVHTTENFARDVVHELANAAAKTDAVNLVLIAAPEFLGHLRNLLNSNVKAMVAAEISKDLTAHKADDIEDIVTRQLKG